MKVAYVEENILDDLRTNKVELIRYNQKYLIDKIKDERKDYYNYQQRYQVIDTQPLLEDMRENANESIVFLKKLSDKQFLDRAKNRKFDEFDHYYALKKLYGEKQFLSKPQSRKKRNLIEFLKNVLSRE